MLKDLGSDLSSHHSKSLEEAKQFAPFYRVVTMCCGDACPRMPAKRFIDWQIPDPRDMNAKDFKKAGSLIKEKVKGLLQELD